MKKLLLVLVTLAIFAETGYSQTARIEIDYENSVGLWMDSDTILTCTDVEIAFKYTCDYSCHLLTSVGFLIYTDDGGTWWELEGEAIESDPFYDGVDEIFVSHLLGANDGPPSDTVGLATVAIFNTGWVTPDVATPFKIKFYSGNTGGSHIKIDVIQYTGYEMLWQTFGTPCDDYEGIAIVPEWSGPYEFTLLELPCLYQRGDVNCSGGDPDIADITRLIDYLYLSHNPICCIDEADVNGSGGEPDMADITRLIDYLYLSREPLETMPGCF
ncbi:MAG: hypothetical protein ACOYVF_09485 [Candidatus Zixiibacteriota bacterium]